MVLDGDGETYGDYKVATRAIEYLERYRDKPFFLAVGFVKPHSPPAAPKKFFDLYDQNKIPLPPDFNTRPRAPRDFRRSQSRVETPIFSSAANPRRMPRVR